MGAREVILLDGGTGTELRERGVEVPCHRTSIWSAHALIAAPDEVVAVHREYIEAGARVVTACNYAVTPTLLAREGMGDRVEELSVLAVELARRAAEESGEEVRVAASLPPLDTSYRADLVAPDAELHAEYSRIAEVLAPRVDVLLCETLSLSREAVVAAECALETGREVWLSWTLQGNRPGLLPGGERLEEAFAAAAHLPVHAHMVNCCGANLLTEAMPRLAALSDRPIGGYANAADALPGDFDPLDPEEVPYEDLDPIAYADAALRWVEAGATLVGGCCHTRPAHLDEVRRRLS
ncbi:MAG: homocysteine S-methyltransferase family protein [Planctomycetes bacterium]|nr:homocysteine S-methyltransferase family protein [Planctomycetota bacterium]MCH2106279.1 homocysteine S-methyltransferase family protein [Planctomycetota bacterium]